MLQHVSDALGDFLRAGRMVGRRVLPAALCVIAGQSLAACLQTSAAVSFHII
jgi:hypothetical protein